MSRFRPVYRQLTDAEKAHVDLLKSKAEGLEITINDIPHPRYKALALTALEEAVMWATKGIT